ncbi:MAG: hypothetical protein ABIO46_09310 [Chitinophagales bacterium]
MKKIRLRLLAVLICISYVSAIAQSSEQAQKPKIPFKDRIFVGGNLGLTFGTITNIEVAPLVGYELTPNWAAGVGLRYSYYQDNYYSPPYKTNIFGGMLFTRYILYKGLFLEGDFEANNFEVYRLVDPINGIYAVDREWIPSLLLGGGYSQPLGGHSAFFLSILYDVLQNKYSPYYGVPVIRAGFAIGL